MICMSALLMLAVSCKKDKKDEIENAGSGFRATVESHAGDSKTHLDGLAVKWDSGDAILVKSNTCTTPRGFTTQESGDNVNFDADATLPTNFYAPPYTGYYPASAFEGDQLTLPATQTYVAGSFGNGANPMAATSSETLLPFKNICGVLKLQLHGTSAYGIDNITITSNTDEQLWGTGTVTLSGGIPSLGTLSGGGSTLTLSCGGATMSTSSAEPSTYFFVVPVGALGTSFTVKVADNNGGFWEKTAASAANTIARSQITAMPELAVTTRIPVSPSSVTITGSCVNCAYNVGGSVTVPSGSHNCEFGLVYSADDNTPTIAEGADKIVVHDMSADPVSGTVNFTADLTDLAVGITYHVRSYAIIDGITYSTEVKDIVGGNFPQAMTWTGGKSPKQFSVSATKKVYFSQGNLQYIGSTGTWKFADHQFDFLGDNGQGSTSQTADRDLFGWGTSGWNNGNHFYQPYDTDESTYPSSVGYGYGPTDGTSYTFSLTGDYANADWGVHNTISNGGSNSWRTLTGGEGGEWDYLISSRPNAANLYGMGKVGNCTPGLIILPDDWTLPVGLTFTSGESDWANVYTYSEWAQMEAEGAVFLPAAGSREDGWPGDMGYGGWYWSSSYHDNNGACNFNFYEDEIFAFNQFCRRDIGLSVRLVSDYQAGGSANDFGSGTW